ncbi:MAG: MBL fold metallo-hydrolase [Thermoleophilia bacterium]|nr:MBL fold metallo-hydrolase [Thermoleophilia bacterium]
MKSPALGPIHDRITAIGISEYPAYVIQGTHRTLMIDSGVNHLGPLYLSSLADLLGNVSRLDYLLLTHSHYDHVGSAGYLRRFIPGLKIGAHERVAELVRKPSVLERMDRLSASHDELLRHNPAGEDVTTGPFEIDVTLKQDDEIDLRGLTCIVYETPGHTRDSLAFYFPEIKALFPGDATGVLRTGPGTPLQVEFVASYQDYVDSLRLMVSLRPECVCLPHNWVLTHEDATEFLAYSLAETSRYRAFIERCLEEAGGDVEGAIERLLHVHFGPGGVAPQPTLSDITNITAQVRLIAGLQGGH